MNRYEIHLTVSAEADDERLRQLAGGLGVKYTRIQLDRGDHAGQPMLSWLTAAGGTAQAAEAEAREITARLGAEGVRVTRLKVEAAADGREAPVTEAQAVTQPGRYFEHHVKLLLPAGSDFDRVREVAVRHGARLSRNTRRVRADGVQERFVTQRRYRVARSTAAGALAGLLEEIDAEGWTVAEVEREWVLVDDNPALDEGWFG